MRFLHHQIPMHINPHGSATPITNLAVPKLLFGWWSKLGSFRNHMDKMGWIGGQ